MTDSNEKTITLEMKESQNTKTRHRTSLFSVDYISILIHLSAHIATDFVSKFIYLKVQFRADEHLIASGDVVREILDCRQNFHPKTPFQYLFRGQDSQARGWIPFTERNNLAEKQHSNV